ncbi:MAG: hypothetical protein IPF54_16550 [Draconibacterium sp.]|nr:hypothetical protein [Draconibacterium sp.]
MILRILKSREPFDYFLYLIVGLLFWTISFRFPYSYKFFEGENESILYHFIDKITSHFPILQVVLSFVLVMFGAFLIQQINSRYALIKARTKLPAVIYIIIIGGFTAMHTLHPVFFAAIFTLLGLNSLFSIFNNSNPQLEIFNSGLFIAIGTLFYFNLIVLLPAFFIAVSILRRERNWREFMILIVGFIIPVAFALTYAFFTDQLTDAIVVFQKNIFSRINHFKTNYPLQGFLGLLILLTLIGSIKIMQQYDSRKVSIRKYYLVLFVIFSFSMLSFIFIPATSQEMLVIAVIPVTILISNLFVSIESVFWRELLFTLLLGTAIFIQFADKLFFTA